jgi:hypothetical protein
MDENLDRVLCNDHSSAKLDAPCHPPALMMDENLDRVLCNDHSSAKLDASYHPPALMLDDNLDTAVGVPSALICRVKPKAMGFTRIRAQG